MSAFDTSFPNIIKKAHFTRSSLVGNGGGFARDDTDEDKLRKLEAMLLREGTSAQDVALIANLLSVPVDARYPTLDSVHNVRSRRRSERCTEGL